MIRILAVLVLAALSGCSKPPELDSHWVIPVGVDTTTIEKMTYRQHYYAWNDSGLAAAHRETIPSHLELYRRVLILEKEIESMKAWRERLWQRNPEIR